MADEKKKKNQIISWGDTIFTLDLSQKAEKWWEIPFLNIFISAYTVEYVYLI